jgi:hypothetical protein
MATIDEIQDRVKTEVRKDILTSVKKVEGYSTKQPGTEPLFLLGYIGFLFFAIFKILEK